MTIPVIASGGAGRPEHLRDVLTAGKADAALVASMVHYGNLHDSRPQALPERLRHPGARHVVTATRQTTSLKGRYPGGVTFSSRPLSSYFSMMT